MGELEDLRDEIDQFLKHHPQSPIEPDDRDDFDGLQYYSPNPDLRFEVEVERLPEDEPAITMQTSTGDEQEFRRWGRFSFEVAGEIATLTVYSNPDGHDFFLPFKDSTNGSETYGAGRYMDEHRPGLERLANGRILVDFNYAYNPYCAYSPYYSCPLPPRENWLQIPIRAGEKNFGQ
ncbi:MAG: DUF1684 domain-containing protein [Candidatus Promineifilaceae bacterium]